MADIYNCHQCWQNIPFWDATSKFISNSNMLSVVTLQKCQCQRYILTRACMSCDMEINYDYRVVCCIMVAGVVVEMRMGQVAGLSRRGAAARGRGAVVSHRSKLPMEDKIVSLQHGISSGNVRTCQPSVQRK